MFVWAIHSRSQSKAPLPLGKIVAAGRRVDLDRDPVWRCVYYSRRGEPTANPLQRPTISLRVTLARSLLQVQMVDLLLIQPFRDPFVIIAVGSLSKPLRRPYTSEVYHLIQAPFNVLIAL